MFSFFKKKSKYPAFRLLNLFYKKRFYFSRNAEWAEVDAEHIIVTDPQSFDVITLNNWHRLIFIQANGALKIEDFVYSMADYYTEKIPFDLDKVIIETVLELEKKGLLLLTDKKQLLPPAFDAPGMKGY